MGIRDVCAISYSGLMSLRCCSLISVPCWWNIEGNLCVTLIIYQESLHDARSTKYKIF